jgi:hypothetical protein
MFIDKTLFILGAGASYPYGFPLGKDLIKKIINSVRKDQVFFPYTENNRNNVNQENHPLELHDYKIFHGEDKPDRCLSEIRKSLNMEGEIKKLIKAFTIPIARKSAEGTRYKLANKHDLVTVSLNSIEKLRHLADDLEEFDPVSIDSFLRGHREHEDAGKVMIIYCLLHLHNSYDFKISEKELQDTALNRKINGAKDRDNWYSYLLNDVTSGCRDPQDILKNDISILTFNYDVSLDFYLKDHLSRISYFQENKKNYAEEFLKKMELSHVYGKVCDAELTKELYEINSVKKAVVPTNNSDKNIRRECVSFHHLLYAYLNRDNIKLIEDRKSADDDAQLKYKQMIQDAANIIIIGFSFDRDNLDVL